MAMYVSLDYCIVGIRKESWPHFISMVHVLHISNFKNCVICASCIHLKLLELENKILIGGIR